VRRALLPIVVLALSLSIRPTARADGLEAMENLEQFAQIAGVLQGFSPRGEVWRGQLTPGEATLITETLMVGNEYLILATGDADAIDLKLELFDAELRPVDADLDDDNLPLVSVTPTVSGEYYIRVTLESAAGPSAWYALQVMYR
jgi:hypothetical protein